MFQATDSQPLAAGQQFVNLLCKTNPTCDTELKEPKTNKFYHDYQNQSGSSNRSSLWEDSPRRNSFLNALSDLTNASTADSEYINHAATAKNTGFIPVLPPFTINTPHAEAKAKAGNYFFQHSKFPNIKSNWAQSKKYLFHDPSENKLHSTPPSTPAAHYPWQYRRQDSNQMQVPRQPVQQMPNSCPPRCFLSTESARKFYNYPQSTYVTPRHDDENVFPNSVNYRPNSPTYISTPTSRNIPNVATPCDYNHHSNHHSSPVLPFSTYPDPFLTKMQHHRHQPIHHSESGSAVMPLASPYPHSNQIFPQSNYHVAPHSSYNNESLFHRPFDFFNSEATASQNHCIYDYTDDNQRQHPNQQHSFQLNDNSAYSSTNFWPHCQSTQFIPAPSPPHEFLHPPPSYTPRSAIVNRDEGMQFSLPPVSPSRQTHGDRRRWFSNPVSPRRTKTPVTMLCKTSLPYMQTFDYRNSLRQQRMPLRDGLQENFSELHRFPSSTESEVASCNYGERILDFGAPTQFAENSIHAVDQAADAYLVNRQKPNRMRLPEQRQRAAQEATIAAVRGAVRRHSQHDSNAGTTSTPRSRQNGAQVMTTGMENGCDGGGSGDTYDFIRRDRSSYSKGKLARIVDGCIVEDSLLSGRSEFGTSEEANRYRWLERLARVKQRTLDEMAAVKCVDGNRQMYFDEGLMEEERKEAFGGEDNYAEDSCLRGGNESVFLLSVNGNNDDVVEGEGSSGCRLSKQNNSLEAEGEVLEVGDCRSEQNLENVSYDGVIPKTTNTNGGDCRFESVSANRNGKGVLCREIEKRVDRESDGEMFGGCSSGGSGSRSHLLSLPVFSGNRRSGMAIKWPNCEDEVGSISQVYQIDQHSNGGNRVDNRGLGLADSCNEVERDDRSGNFKTRNSKCAPVLSACTVECCVISQADVIDAACKRKAGHQNEQNEQRNDVLTSSKMQCGGGVKVNGSVSANSEREEEDVSLMSDDDRLTERKSDEASPIGLPLDLALSILNSNEGSRNVCKCRTDVSGEGGYSDCEVAGGCSGGEISNIGVGKEYRRGSGAADRGRARDNKIQKSPANKIDSLVYIRGERRKGVQVEMKVKSAGKKNDTFPPFTIDVKTETSRKSPLSFYTNPVTTTNAALLTSQSLPPEALPALTPQRTLPRASGRKSRNSRGHREHPSIALKAFPSSSSISVSPYEFPQQFNQIYGSSRSHSQHHSNDDVERPQVQTQLYPITLRRTRRSNKRHSHFQSSEVADSGSSVGSTRGEKRPRRREANKKQKRSNNSRAKSSVNYRQRVEDAKERNAAAPVRDFRGCHSHTYSDGDDFDAPRKTAEQHFRNGPRQRKTANVFTTIHHHKHWPSSQLSPHPMTEPRLSKQNCHDLQNPSIDRSPASLSSSQFSTDSNNSNYGPPTSPSVRHLHHTPNRRSRGQQLVCRTSGERNVGKLISVLPSIEMVEHGATPQRSAACGHLSGMTNQGTLHCMYVDKCDNGYDRDEDDCDSWSSCCTDSTELLMTEVSRKTSPNAIESFIKHRRTHAPVPKARSKHQLDPPRSEHRREPGHGWNAELDDENMSPNVRRSVADYNIDRCEVWRQSSTSNFQRGRKHTSYLVGGNEEESRAGIHGTLFDSCDGPTSDMPDKWRNNDLNQTFRTDRDNYHYRFSGGDELMPLNACQPTAHFVKEPTFDEERSDTSRNAVRTERCNNWLGMKVFSMIASAIYKAALNRSMSAAFFHWYWMEPQNKFDTPSATDINPPALGNALFPEEHQLCISNARRDAAAGQSFTTESWTESLYLNDCQISHEFLLASRVTPTLAAQDDRGSSCTGSCPRPDGTPSRCRLPKRPASPKSPTIWSCGFKDNAKENSLNHIDGSRKPQQTYGGSDNRKMPNGSFQQYSHDHTLLEKQSPNGRIAVMQSLNCLPSLNSLHSISGVCTPKNTFAGEAQISENTPKKKRRRGRSITPKRMWRLFNAKR